MSVTSQWEWVDIPEELDVQISIVSGSARYRKRSILTPVRKRISNAAYVSQLGETATSLSAYNAGSTITTTAPETLSGVMFPEATVSNWTKDYTFWTETGTVVNGRPSYWNDSINSPDATKRNVIWLGSTEYSGWYQWVCCESTTALVAAGTWNKLTTYTNGIGTGAYTSLSSAPLTPAGQNFSLKPWQGSLGTFSGAASAVTTKDSIPLTCISDVRTFEQNGVDWYTQTQTWKYTSAWVEYE